jgi:hypothetical protein
LLSANETTVSSPTKVHELVTIAVRKPIHPKARADARNVELKVTTSYL